MEQIKLNGGHTSDEDQRLYTVTFGKLMDKTDGMFEALLGTLLTARRHKVRKREGGRESRSKRLELTAGEYILLLHTQNSYL